MSRQTFRAVFTSKQVQTILADWYLQQRGLDVEVGANAESEFMACASKDENGAVQLNQYRLEFTVDVQGESWKT